jgi:hypothetical protein
MTLPIEYQNLIARRALEVVEPTPGAVDRFRARSSQFMAQVQRPKADILHLGDRQVSSLF